MSLINDALKRAKQAQKENPPPPSALQFKAADPNQRRDSGPPILLIVAIVVVLALVGLFVVMAMQKRPTDQLVANAKQPNTIVPQTTAPSAVSPVVNPVPVQQPTPATTQSQPTPAVSQPAVAPATTTNTAAALVNATPSANAAPTDAGTNVATVADAQPPKPALPKLQGIFYRPGSPSAVINGKTVLIGNRVGEFQVLAITPENVTIGSATQTNVLTLAE